MELVCGYGKAEGIDQIEVHFLSAEGHAGLVGLVVLELLAGDPVLHAFLYEDGSCLHEAEGDVP